ncbi:MAG: Rpn family recombination-promoting nuclease/putative transposase [Rickettsiales bacterium]|nr:Rpn family recombination-promoting nuclease/putative transposase [Rickettsiales bacterium]
MTNIISSAKTKNTMRHDDFVKRGLSHPKVAREVIEQDIPKKIISLVDMTTLREEKTDFTDIILKRGQSDCLFSVKLKNGRSGYFYFLLEAQSSIDKFMNIRLLKYMIAIYERHAKKYPDEKYAPFVYPVVIHNGKYRYTGSMSFWEEFGDVEQAKACFPDPMHLIDLPITENSEINLKSKYYRSAYFYALKNIHAKDVYKAIEEERAIIEKLGKKFKESDLIISMAYYIITTANTSDRRRELIELFADCVSEEYKGEIMTIAQQFENDGMKKGIEKRTGFIVNNMLKKNLEVSEIASMTGLRISEIKKILKKKEV